MGRDGFFIFPPAAAAAESASNIIGVFCCCSCKPCFSAMGLSGIRPPKRRSWVGVVVPTSIVFSFSLSVLSFDAMLLLSMLLV